MTVAPQCYSEVDVPMSGRDLWVTRLALEQLLANSTRHEHWMHDIRAALAKLPEAHEPGGSACACVAAEPARRPQS